MEDQLNDEEEVRIKNRQKRLEEMRINKQKQMIHRMYMKKAASFALGIFTAVVLMLGGRWLFFRPATKNQATENQITENQIIGNQITENQMTENREADQDSESSQNFQMSRILEGIQTAGSGGESIFNDSRMEAEAGFGEQQENANAAPKTYQANLTSGTVQIGDYLTQDKEFYSEYAILIDLGDNNVIAEKFGKTRINPASMTKILTVLVAAEHINMEDLDDQFTMTPEITDYGYIHGCSSAGFVKNEVVTVKDMLYGTILPSGADAAMGLAVYVAGSHEAFVDMMNEKLKELGLSGTAHFTNCVGVYDEEHYCTAYDIAMIMEAAIDNELCRDVLTAHTYTTTVTEQHPEGIILSNWFLRRIEDQEGGEGVICAKTGYVVQSGSCAASYAEDQNGKGYICVTAGANSQWRCIYDHAGLYLKYMS